MLGIREEKLDNALDFMLVKVVNRLRCQIGRQLKHLNMTSEQLVVLVRLWEQDGLSQKELADKIFKDQANTTRILDKVEKKGLVRRVDALNDRRAYLIYLTDEGKRCVEQCNPLVLHIKAKMFNGLTDNDSEALRRTLDTISRNLE
ncbi:MarR family winged helix-turn-helix transcriptional regulator [Geobacter argillaceus]|uniref:DNA-binding MarR family transcriptional regulator n=1 Tax=Geobacter argillaceus TaxID=345631 RepID=A0A562VIC6_9BACT|nr:MarR family transcriptional regulator [Geobacter argillaceus]TWJ17588.1 DNA-binding MarR family transcriptional regulator [Geobacter argillaceus]